METEIVMNKINNVTYMIKNVSYTKKILIYFCMNLTQIILTARSKLQQKVSKCNKIIHSNISNRNNRLKLFGNMLIKTVEYIHMLEIFFIEIFQFLPK